MEEDKKRTYKTKKENIVKLSSFYKKIKDKTNGKRNIRQ